MGLEEADAGALSLPGGGRGVSRRRGGEGASRGLPSQDIVRRGGRLGFVRRLVSARCLEGSGVDCQVEGLHRGGLIGGGL
jgi:hypothetical protein